MLYYAQRIPVVIKQHQKRKLMCHQKQLSKLLLQSSTVNWVLVAGVLLNCMFAANWVNLKPGDYQDLWSGDYGWVLVSMHTQGLLITLNLEMSHFLDDSHMACTHLSGTKPLGLLPIPMQSLVDSYQKSKRNIDLKKLTDRTKQLCVVRSLCRIPCLCRV